MSYTRGYTGFDAFSVTGRFHCDDDTTGGIGAEMDDELLPNSA